MAKLAIGIEKVRIGVPKPTGLLDVEDLAAASRHVAAQRTAHMANGKGPSTFPRFYVYDVSGKTPQRLGVASWNATIWPIQKWEPGLEPLYSPRAED